MVIPLEFLNVSGDVPRWLAGVDPHATRVSLKSEVQARIHIFYRVFERTAPNECRLVDGRFALNDNPQGIKKVVLQMTSCW